MKYGKDQLYVRLNPNTVLFDERIRLEEAVLKPANPQWIQNLMIYNDNKTGSSYFLEDSEPSDQQVFWEQNINKIIRLEVSAKRDGSGNFSMMLEELCEKYIDYGYLFGRCIHLDSEDPVGTNIDEVKLKHLDLAINVYNQNIITDRMSCNLANRGTVTDASTRSHILRVDNVKFKDLLVVAETFFVSETLTNEWIRDQFR